MQPILLSHVRYYFEYAFNGLKICHVHTNAR